MPEEGPDPVWCGAFPGSEDVPVPHVPSAPWWTHTCASSRTASGELTASVTCPGVANVTVALPSEAVVAGVAAPVIEAPEAGALAPELS